MFPAAMTLTSSFGTAQGTGPYVSESVDVRETEISGGSKRPVIVVQGGRRATSISLLSAVRPPCRMVTFALPGAEPKISPSSETVTGPIGVAEKVASPGGGSQP